MTQLANTISGFVPSQLPEYIATNYPNFKQFLESYFQFLEDSMTGNTVYQIRNINNYYDVDKTPDAFLSYFQNNFLPNFPQNIELDLRKLLKVATKFYQTKGSQNSIEFLFRVLYNLQAQVYYPAKNILRTSAGKWQQPKSIKLLLSSENSSFNVASLAERTGMGTESNTQCVIESVDKYIDPNLGVTIVELFLSNVIGSFIPGESIQITAGTYSNGNNIIFTEGIISFLSSITVDPQNQGLLYNGTSYYSNGTINYPGDPVSIIGGLNPINGIEAIAYVGNVSLGSIQSVSVVDGGYGFQLYPNTIVTVTTAAGDNGSGANIDVNGLDTANLVHILFNTDSIYYKANVVLSNTDYGFSNVANANIDTVIGDALSYINVAMAPLSSLDVLNGGSGYATPPVLKIESIFNTDWANDLYTLYLTSSTANNLANWEAAAQPTSVEGLMAAVRVLNGGTNYSNTLDTIVVDSEIGRGATFDFITDANGAITSVSIITRGDGYPVSMPPLLVVNSANYSNSSNGSGASLKAYGYNSGQDLTLSVSDIGRVEDIRLQNEGFDYTSTPNVSLRNEDVVISAISNNQFYYQGDVVYQGANQNSASFLAYVDQYDRSNNILRLYNYTGTINISTDLIGSNFNSTPISVTVYGNGKAKATAQFYGGLIKHTGFWLGTDGFLSADQYLEGPTKYHTYSYLLKVEKNLADYYKTVKNIVHPAGTVLLSLSTITSVSPINNDSLAETIQLANTSNTPGVVTIDAYGNGTIVGTNTTFVGNVNVGDLFVIDSNVSSRLQTKLVSNVVNDTTLLLESNTEYFGFDRLKTNANSNVVISTANSTNLAINDVIQTNVNNNVQSSIVISISGNNITLNTVFAVNTTNTGYLVWPIMDNVAYEIYRG